MWYLSEELVPLALCDQSTLDVNKAAIVTAMLQAGRPQQIPPQKPMMNDHLLTNHVRGEVQLQSFVGERSWLIFDRLDVPCDWMQLQPSEWINSADFMRFNDLVHSLEVVNDCAERAIKDVTEFVNYAKDANSRDRVMMVVNHHRQICDLRHLTKQQMDDMDNFI